MKKLISNSQTGDVKFRWNNLKSIITSTPMNKIKIVKTAKRKKVSNRCNTQENGQAKNSKSKFQ